MVNISFVNLPVLKEEVKNTVEFVLDDWNDYEVENGVAEYVLETLVPGSYGIYIPNELAKIVGIENLGYKYDGKTNEYIPVDDETARFENIKDDEFVYENIENFFNEFNDEINEKIDVNKYLPEGYVGFLYLGFNEYWGSVDIFLRIEKEQ